MSNYISFYQVINLVALLISLYASLGKKRKINLLSLFLLFLCITDFIFANIEVYYWGHNYLSYNICMIGCILFYYSIFRKKNDFKIDILVSLWTLSALVYIITSPYNLNTETYVIGLIIVTSLILIQFYEDIFISDYVPLGSDYKTWLGLGITIFLYCAFPILLFMDYLILSNPAFSAFYALLNCGNFILSTFYLIAAIVQWKKI